jgi:hypothetical protein
MSTLFLKTVTLLALTAFSALALADPPAIVGRVSLAQGQVSISGEVGDGPSAALVNWPVTSHNQITTGRDARTEFRIGSTSVRLDGDSALEVTELDDDSLRLRLHYGSATVRIRNADVLRGFEFSTPQAQVRLQEPGRVRIDAERVADTSVVNVFDGVALVDGGGSALTLRAGRRAEIHNDDVRTALAVRDSFDDWALLRDQRDEHAAASRYVSTDMTGYEDLDQHGIWRDDSEYGPLWQPRAVPMGWAPYRDGRWTWVSPWGWTWVDNAPWGYAPFHYGRWLFVNQRWCWAPGRNVGRPVWSPALVGWVGGSGWNATFTTHGRRHPAPAQGWYPLTPRDNFVPGYRLSREHLGQINRHVRPDSGRDWRERRGDYRRDGVTVVPHDQFGRRGTIVVRDAPKAVLPPLALQNAPAATAPAGPRERGRDPRMDGRFDRDGQPRHRSQDRGLVLTAPPAVVTGTAPAPAAPRAQLDSPAQPVMTGQPAAVPAPPPRRDHDGRAFEERRRDGRFGFDDGRRQRPMPPAAGPNPLPVARQPVAVAPQPVSVAPPPVAVAPQPVSVAPQPVSVAPQPVSVAPQPVSVAPQRAAEPAPAHRFGRSDRGEQEHERRYREPRATAPQAMQPSTAQPMQPAAAIARPMAPPPAPAANPAAPPEQQNPAAQEARQRRMERGARGEQGERGR